MKLQLTTCFLLFTFFLLSAQDFGAHPGGQHWQLMKSDAARVIYPTGMEAQAQRILSIIDDMDENRRESVGIKKKRIDIVLRAQTVNPNGYVALAPFRSEFFATPPQSSLVLGTLGWLDVLTIHEYRHVQQFINARQGITTLSYIFQGEGLSSILMAAALPNWYFEGDAVIAETAFTNAGRGRHPFFTKEQRALAYAGKDYRYMKHRNGSFKSLLPNHYPLGYMMLNKAREIAGNESSAKILKRGASYIPIPFYSYSFAMKRYTGLHTSGLYKQSWEEKKEQWKQQLDTININRRQVITDKQDNIVTSYRFPMISKDGSIIARKSAFNETDHLVRITNNKEEKLTTIGFNNDVYLHHKNGQVVWTEFKVNPRRNHESFSNIVLYDVEKDKRRLLTKKTKYFSPTISNSGKTIAAIEYSANQQNHIHILDAKTGSFVKQLDNPNKYFFSRCVFTEDDKRIVTIAKNLQGLALISIDIESGSITKLTPFSHHTIESPYIFSNKLFFNASYTGIDNIFSTDLSGTMEIFQETSAIIGAYDPVVNDLGTELVYTEFTEMGYLICKINSASRSQNIVSVLSPTEMDAYQTEANVNERAQIPENVELRAYETRDYNKILRGLKLHSWQFSTSENTPSLTFDFDNILHELSVDTEIGFNLSESSTPYYQIEMKSGRFFPVLGFVMGDRKRLFSGIEKGVPVVTRQREYTIGGSIELPFNWLQTNYTSTILPKVDLGQRFITGRTVNGDYRDDISISIFEARILASHLRRTALQNIGPRAGISLLARYSQTLTDTYGERFQIETTAYLPAISKNHGLRLRVGYFSENSDNNYQFIDAFQYARGYEVNNNWDNYTNINVTYGVPITYPDVGLYGIIFFKRLRANIFHDYGIGNFLAPDFTTIEQSSGIELVIDSKVMTLFDTSFGLRTSYRHRGNIGFNFQPFIATNF